MSAPRKPRPLSDAARAARCPPPPDQLVGALQDRVHADPSQPSARATAIARGIVTRNASDIVDGWFEEQSHGTLYREACDRLEREIAQAVERPGRQVSDLRDASTAELAAELTRRGAMPGAFCPCGKWRTYVSPYDADRNTLRCHGCLRAVDKCACR